MLISNMILFLISLEKNINVQMA